MNPAADPLAAMRDIHLPAVPHWWPPAIGWWIVAAIVLAVIFFFGRYLIRRYRAGRPARFLVTGLENISLNGPPRELHQSLAAMSRLARQYAITRYGRTSIASLHGEQWLGFLDRSSGTLEFSKGPGRILVEGLYQQPSETLQTSELEALRDSLKRWARASVRRQNYASTS